MLFNYERKKTETTSTRETSSYARKTKFFESTQGEVYINEAVCPVYKVDIDSTKPTFTGGFIKGIFSAEIVPCKKRLCQFN